MTRLPRLAALTLPLALAACGGEKAPPPPPAAAGPAARILATIGDSASRVEGLAEHGGHLYTADWKDGALYRIDTTGAVTKVGALPTKPGQSILGLAADREGNVYAAVPDAGIVYRVDAARLGAADFDAAKDARAFATNAKGANGIAFDRAGHLWISGGDQNVVYHVGPTGGIAQLFAKDVATVSPDTTMPVRAYVTNGMAFDAAGNAFTLNTGTGAVTRLEVRPEYQPGVVTVIGSDTRCLGADGLIATPGDTLYIACNFSSRVMRLAPDGSWSVVHESTPAGDNVLRFPSELKRVGNTLYVVNLDFPFGANAGQPQKGATVAAIRLR